MTAQDRHNVTIKAIGGENTHVRARFWLRLEHVALRRPAFERDYRVVLFDHVGAGGADPAAYALSALPCHPASIRSSKDSQPLHLISV